LGIFAFLRERHYSIFLGDTGIEKFEVIDQRKVARILMAKGKITDGMMTMLSKSLHRNSSLMTTLFACKLN